MQRKREFVPARNPNLGSGRQIHVDHAALQTKVSFLNHFQAYLFYRHACVNNHIQNPRAAWKDTQCQPFTHPENSVCRCCCDWNYCNGKEYAGCRGLAYWKTTTEVS
jgi:hypothetical protein